MNEAREANEYEKIAAEENTSYGTLGGDPSSNTRRSDVRLQLLLLLLFTYFL